MAEEGSAAVKRFYIEIIGGDSDGLTLDSQSENPIERQQVAGILSLTNNGEVDTGLRGLLLAKLRSVLEGRAGTLIQLVRWPGFKAEYLVAERLEEKNEVLIRLKYQGQHLPFHDRPIESEPNS